MSDQANSAKVLQEILDWIGKSAADVAREINVQRSAISNVLAGRQALGAAMQIKLHRTYGVSFEFMDSGRGPIAGGEAPEVSHRLRKYIEFLDNNPDALRVLDEIMNMNAHRAETELRRMEGESRKRKKREK